MDSKRIKYKLYILGFTSLTFPLTSYSVETDIGKIHELAEDVHQAVVEVAPVSDRYHLTTEEADRIQAYSNYQNELAEQINQPTMVGTSGDSNSKADCIRTSLAQVQSDKDEIKEKIKSRKISVGIMASYNTGDELAQAVNQATGFRAFNDQINSSNHQDKGIFLNYANAVRNYLKYRPNISAEWDSYTLEKKAELMQKYIKDKIGLEVASDLMLREHAIYETMSDPSNWKEHVRSINDLLTPKQKFDFLTDVGGRFLQYYNYEGVSSPGAISTEEMWKSLGEGTPGGVCRHVVNAQIQIAKELGFDEKSLYHIAYMSPGVRHDTLALVDPNDPNKLHKINYYSREEDASNKGEAQLKQGGGNPEVGTNYVVSDHTGKPILQMPTELGKMLRDASGYTKRQTDISKTYNIAKMSVNTKYGTGSVFAGETSNGTKLTGISFSKTNTDLFQYGVALHNSKGENEIMEWDSQGLYGFFDFTPSYIYTHKSESGSKLSMKAEVGGGMEVNISKTKARSKSTGNQIGGDSSTTDVKKYIIPALETRYTTASGDTSVYARVEAENFVYFENENESDGETLHLNSITYKSGISSKITDNLKASLDVAVVTQTLGDYYVVSSGIEDTKRRYTASLMHQAPIGDVVSFAPGATSVTQASFSKDFTTEDGTGGILHIEYTEDEIAGGRVGLNGEWVF